MRHPLSNRDTRAVIAGVFTLTLAATALKGLPALRSWTDEHRRLARQAALLLRDARAASALVTAVDDSARARRLRASAMDSAFISGRTVAHAAATLVGEIAENAEVVDAQVEALQADSVHDPRAALRRLRVRGSVTGELDSIMEFLLLVESGPRLMVVRNLSMSRSNAGSANQPEVVLASFVIEAAARVSPTEARR